MDLSGLETLLLVCGVAAAAPIIASVLPGPRIAQVVLLIIGGALIGPEVLGLEASIQVELISNVGVGFLFLMAGYELDPKLFREREGRMAIYAWLCSVVIAMVVVALLEQAGLVRDFLPIAIALTTTALGTLLPILHDNDMLGGVFGRYVMATGAVGELFPIMAIALFLSANSQFVAIIALASIGILASVLMLLSRGIRGRALERIVLEGADTTAQSTVRWTIVLLLALLVTTGEFGIDAVLGAFIAGAVLRRWAGEGAGAIGSKLDAIGYGFFIPVFFVFSGMTLHLQSIMEAPGRLVACVVLLLLVRAVPVLLVHRRALDVSSRFQLALCSATTLPLLVALAEIGRRNGTMLPENAAALVGGGVLSVLIFPTIAVALRRRALAREAAS
ncbi:MAG TPA: cation:proton antiporter [Nocardioidaceae bacterium]|nr:cation:proton antiporter [Nocardioidaceae bacterium]